MEKKPSEQPNTVEVREFWVKDGEGYMRLERKWWIDDEGIEHDLPVLPETNIAVWVDTTINLDEQAELTKKVDDQQHTT